VFKHFFPYWKDASDNPEIILKNALYKALADHSAVDLLETLRLMTAPLNDGHIWISLQGDTSRSHSVPILLDWVENKLVIDKIMDSALNNKMKQGDIIRRINNVATDEYITAFEKSISGSSQWKRRRSKIEILGGIENSTITLEIERNGQISQHELSRNTSYYYEMANERPSGFIKKGIFYIDLNILSFDSIKTHLRDLQNAKGIICDLRGYPNGNHKFISYLLKKNENTKWMFIPQIIYPDYENVSYAGFGWNVQPENESIKAKVIFITDGRAISYAESYMGYIKDFKLATIIGQPTAGTNGDVNTFLLPGGYRISWTGMLVKNHDGSQHHLKGILPDVYAERTIKGVAEGRDELLEKAIELAEK
jgi:C-terminal processing protease CtpA/Prc